MSRKPKTDNRFFRKESLFLIQTVSASGEEEWWIPGVWTGSTPFWAERQWCFRTGRQLGYY